MKNYDITDYIVSGDVEKVAELASNCTTDASQIHIPSPEDNAQRDPNEFGVCIYHPRNGFMNKYAAYSKGMTELNLGLLKTQINEIPDEILKVASTNLQKAAAHYKLDFPEELKPFVSEEKLDNNIVNITSIDETAYHVKLASTAPPIEHLYALPKKKKYPITNTELVKTAESYFNTYNKDLELDDRIEFATNLNKQMITLGISPTGLIDKLAHLDYNKLNSDFEYHIKSRIGYTHDEEVAGLYEALLEKSAEWGVKKVASTLNKIDQKANLTYYYGKNIEDPILSTFGLDKEAEYEIDGKTWKDSDFDKIAKVNFSDLLDSNTISELSGEDRIAVFKSLPKPIRDNIANEIL